MNSPYSTSSCLPARRQSAFTLVEMLAVVAIMVAIMVMVAPAVTGLRNASDITKTIYDISGLLEGAKAQAMAKNSYVWVGFASDPDATQVIVSVKTLPDGSKPASFNSPTLVSLGKPETFQNVRLVTNLGDFGGKKPPADCQLAASTNANSFQSSVGGVSYEFKKIIEFNSLGEARRIEDASLPRRIEVGLQPTRGTMIDPSGNNAALQIAGLTGQTRIFRP